MATVLPTKANATLLLKTFWRKPRARLSFFRPKNSLPFHGPGYWCELSVTKKVGGSTFIGTNLIGDGDEARRMPRWFSTN